MAADSGVWQDELYVGDHQKIYRLNDGSLIAAAGPRPSILAFRAWMNAERADNLRPPAVDDGQFGGLWLKPDCTIWRVSFKFEIYGDPSFFAAEGMHCNFMLGAMAQGATAEEAVRLAMRYGSGRGEIQVERVGGF